MNRATRSLTRLLLACAHNVTEMQKQLATRYLNEVGRSTVHPVLIDVSEMRKMRVRWVRRQLTDVHKENRLGGGQR